VAATKYTYSISGDFPNAKEDSSRLSREILDSSISTPLERIDTDGDDCDIWFDDVLSGGDKTTLDGLVAAHTGEPMPDTTCNRTDRDPTVNDDDTWGFGVGSCWFNLKDLNTWTCLDASDGAAIWRIAAENVEKADVEDETKTNSTKVQDQVVWTGSQPEGNYRVEFTCEVMTTLSEPTYITRDLLISPGILVEFEIDGKDINTFKSLNTEWVPITSYVNISLTEGEHTIKVQFASLYGDTVAIRRARIEIRRNT